MAIEDSPVWLSFATDSRAARSRTFVAHDGIDTCYACTFRAGVTFCRYCSRLLFADGLEDFSDAFDSDHEGSHYYIANDFGYSEHVACAQEAREVIGEKRFEASTDDLERGYTARTKAGSRSHTDRR